MPLSEETVFIIVPFDASNIASSFSSNILCQILLYNEKFAKCF